MESQCLGTAAPWATAVHSDTKLKPMLESWERGACDAVLGPPPEFLIHGSEEGAR